MVVGVTGFKFKHFFMTLDQFYALDEREQHEALWEHILIGDRVDGEHKIILYQIFYFYIKLYYHSKNNALRKLRAFDEVEKLDAYLGKFNLKI